MTTPDRVFAGPGFPGQAVLQHSDNANWRLVDDLHYLDEDGRSWTVPAGARTDLASVPRPVAWVVARTGASVSPAVLHDHLWRTLVPAGVLGYRHADQLLRQALRTVHVPLVIAWLMWAGVRWGSLLTRRGGSIGWWRDAPAVLAITIPALPLVVPPALLCTAALLLLAAVEVLGALAAGRSARRGISVRS